MSREVKRVTMDFDWPMGVVWKGYNSPYRSTECKMCDGSGYNEETKKLADEFYGFDNRQNRWCEKITQDEVEMLVKAGRLWSFLQGKYKYDEETDSWQEYIEDAWIDCKQPKMPSAEFVNTNQDGLHSHDGINRWKLIEHRAKRLGFYGLCKWCNGEGSYWADDSFNKLCEDWMPTEPPKGDGYQMWETTSEGSPKSPVFKTLEELCMWLEENNASMFGKETATKEEWVQRLSDGTAGLLFMSAPPPIREVGK